MKDYLLFDLDGTLTDPKVGITTCVQYALKELGIEEPDLDKLEPFIGPPLKDSFMNFYGMDSKQADRAVAKYRERFDQIGWSENKVYKGIPRMLKKLRAKGVHMAIASSKPTVFVERILKHFKINSYFQVVVGSELDGRRSNKAEVVREAMSRLYKGRTIEADRFYMIGDRCFDVQGARTLGIESVAVSYGYGSLEELKEAHADYIVQSVEELEQFLLRGFLDKPEIKGVGGKLAAIFSPFLVFMITRIFVSMLFASFLPAPLSPNGTLLATLAGFLAAGLVIHKATAEKIQINENADRLNHLFIEPVIHYVYLAVTTIGFAFGLNILLNLIGLTQRSEAFQETSQSQFSGNIFLGILCYCIVSAVSEEYLFRGAIYNTMKFFLNKKAAILLQALFFGIYHLNIVQCIYALLMGLLFVYGYEYFGKFGVTPVMHMLANGVAFFLAYSGISGWFMNWPVCILFLLLGVVGIVLLQRGKGRR